MAQWSLLFDGVDDYVSTTHGVPTGGEHAITVECWIKLHSTDDGRIAGQWTDGNIYQQEWKLWLDGGDLKWTVNDEYIAIVNPDPTTYTLTYEDPPLDTWLHVVGTYVGDDEQRLIVDGVEAQQAVSAYDVNDSSAPLILGKEGTDFANFRMAWLRISSVERYTAGVVIPQTPGFPDADTLLQYDFVDIENWSLASGQYLRNRADTYVYFDGEISGAVWRWDAPNRVDLWNDGTFARFGDEWTILLADEDVTSSVPLESIQITLNLGSARDMAQFIILDQTAADMPASWDTIRIWNGGKLVFSGFLMNITFVPTGINFDIECQCVDWTALLDKRIVSAETNWANKYASVILYDIMEDGYVSEINTTTFVDTGISLVSFDANYAYVGDIVERLANASEYFWFVRENERGQVHLFFSDISLLAPFSLNTSPNYTTSYPLRVLKWTREGSEKVNKLFVDSPWGVYTYTAAVGADPVLLEGSIKVTDYWGHWQYNQATVDKLSVDHSKGTIEIYEPGGLQPGMVIPIVHSVLDVDADFLIHTVKIQPLGGGDVRYELTVSTWTNTEQGFAQEYRKLHQKLDSVLTA